jgi:Meiotically up-regulated gene 113
VRERILNEIRRLAEINDGRPPGAESFERQTEIRRSECLGVYWARWGDAVAEAGLTPNERQGKLDEGLVLRRLAEATRHYGRLPTAMEFRLYRRAGGSIPEFETVKRHFGSKRDLIERLTAWATAGEEFRDLPALLANARETAPTPIPAKIKEGLVYLIRSGAHYKIGRSDEIERRVKEIRVALPDAATLIHSIRTDDPAGIEAYWHRRFAERRANGEWFKLTTADVAAFKRRKYQ